MSISSRIGGFACSYALVWCCNSAHTRIKLEEDYIHGLKKLYSRSKAVDTLHDE